MRTILAIDQGTTSSRALLVDHAGAIVAFAQQEFPQRFPQPGWVEHDPQDIWTSQQTVIRDVLARAAASARDIAAVGIANQRETTLIWDRTSGEPIYPAIVWQDRRTAAWCEAAWAKGLEPMLTARTGLPLDPYFSAGKLAWILEHVPGARSRAEQGRLACGTIDTWLIWQLTGGRVHVTDASNASRTLLLNIHSGAWDPEILTALQIPATLLPTVRPSSGIITEVSAVPELAGVPIAAVIGDQQAALFGQRCLAPGMLKATYGTGCFLLQHTGEKAVASQHRLLTTIAWRIGDRLSYASEGSIFVGGAVVQWLQDGLGLSTSAAGVEALAASVPDSGGVYLVPAFVGLGAPHWDSYARGAIFGLTRGTTAAHLARAALESIAFQVADVVEALTADTGLSPAELRVDGGASTNELVMQCQADLLGIPVLAAPTAEATALGAAYLAGLAVGFWKGAESLPAPPGTPRCFEPHLPRSQAETSRARWKEALHRAMRWDSPPAS